MICPVCKQRHNDRGQLTTKRFNDNTEVLCDSLECEYIFDTWMENKRRSDEYGLMLNQEVSK